MFCRLSDINSPFVKTIIGLDKTDALSTLGKNDDDDVHLGGHASSLTTDEDDDDGDVAILSDDDGIW